MTRSHLLLVLVNPELGRCRRVVIAPKPFVGARAKRKCIHQTKSAHAPGLIKLCKIDRRWHPRFDIGFVNGALRRGEENEQFAQSMQGWLRKRAPSSACACSEDVMRELKQKAAHIAPITA